MSVSQQTPIQTYTANGVTTVFPFPFYVGKSTDLVVDVDGSTQTLGIDYTVSGLGNDAGGNVTLLAAPAAGLTVTVYRDTPIERLEDFQTAGDLNADELDLQFDRLWQVLQELLIGGKVSSRALRVPAGELVSELPPKAQRALRLVGFDANGDVTMNTPADQSAAALALLLASSSLANQGAGAVGFDNTRNYLAGTVGYALKNVTAATFTFKRLKGDFGAVGDGVADDAAKLTTAIAAIPEGGTLLLDGLFRIASTVLVSKRINILCVSKNEGLLVDVGTSADGIVFYGTDPSLLNGINNVELNLNVYGRANACKHAVVMQRVDRSNIKLNIRAGATAYGLRLRGCLINQFDIQSSVNYAPPGVTSPGVQYHHIVADNYGVPTGSFATCSVAGSGGNVITYNGHGFTLNQPVVFSETGTQPPSPYVSGKPYFVINPTTNTFQLAAARSGSPIVTTTATTTPQIATCTAVATNSNMLQVNLEGAHDGYVQAAMFGEGGNTLSGEIEGVLGYPFFVEDNLGFAIRDLRMEANALNATIVNGQAVEVGGAVQYLGGGSYANTLTLRGCRGYKIGDGYYGKLNFDSTNSGGVVGSIMVPDVDSITIADKSVVQLASAVLSTSPTIMGGGAGHPTMQTLFVNPFFDIFDSVATNVGPPIGVTMEGSYTSGDIILETSVVYSRSAFATAAKCLSRGTTITNGAVITPGIQPWKDSGEWVSILLPIYMLSSTYRAFVYIDDGVQYNLIGSTKGSGAYEEIRGSCKLIAGNNWKVRVAITTAANPGVTWASGVQYYMGGLNVVRGNLAPATIDNSLARMAYVHTSISFPPHRQGATAVVGASIYQAVSNGLAADWLKVSP